MSDEVIIGNTKSLNPSKHTCEHCGRGYKTKNKYDKHFVICDFLSKTSRQKAKITAEEMEESLTTPSLSTMYKLLVDLGVKYNRLEEKVDNLNKWVIRKKKNINIVEWLNANSKPLKTFDNLHLSIEVKVEDINHLVSNTFYDTLNLIFERELYYFKEQESPHPIVAFVQKPNTFYVYDNVTDKEGNSSSIWTELTSEKFSSFLIKIHVKMSKYLKEWKKNYNEDIENNERFSMTYDKTIIKLFTPDFRNDSVLTKIRHIMYPKMKTDLKCMIDYEFEC